ncbi:MAG TPA: Uma2 family endonuclease [Blastocatellia bacterium]|nr:Uma2 family endonuclease [Blastocatellia bacterium]
MSTQTNYYMSPEEYLEIERKAEYKSEYSDGVMYVKAGGSERHNLIATNIIGILHRQLLESPCKVYNSDMKVRIFTAKKYCYPDVSVVCGETRFDDEYQDTILNPILIVEVLSDATAGYDRGGKFQAYKQLASFREYILVSQEQYLIEQYVRQGDHSWLYTDVSGLEGLLHLPSIGCSLALRDVYAKTT